MGRVGVRARVWPRPRPAELGPSRRSQRLLLPAWKGTLPLPRSYRRVLGPSGPACGSCGHGSAGAGVVPGKQPPIFIVLVLVACHAVHYTTRSHCGENLLRATATGDAHLLRLLTCLHWSLAQLEGFRCRRRRQLINSASCGHCPLLRCHDTSPTLPCSQSAGAGQGTHHQQQEVSPVLLLMLMATASSFVAGGE